MNATAVTLKEFHKPGTPLVLANVYDILSARAVAELPSCKALATASYSVARASGTEDDDMTLETNLAAVQGIAAVATEFNKPLTVDLQDGYGSRLEEAVGKVVELGVVGINLEDCDKETQNMYSQAEAAGRVRRTLDVAKQQGVPDFVVNARCDTLVRGGETSEVLERGKAYLEAGATTVFVWGGSRRGVSEEEVGTMVKAFDGRLNVAMKMSGGLSVRQLAELGVARCSVGPQIQLMAMETFATQAKKILDAAASE